jgi:hypothetical protein
LQYRWTNSPDDRPSPSGTADVPAVLCIGYTTETLDKRCQLLAQNGYEAHRSSTRDAALGMLHQRAYHALVIGHAVPEPERLEFISAAKALNPEAVVVLLYRDSIRRAEAADAILCIENGPMSLVHALRELLGR